uniref:Uncharacterized protein n=1 Tax=Ananas comosus var. bracteatus TaxID=296719 RepID=A0A6V7P7X8_ANACO|nr:unnamed protein product [Ananas comosus var. bracteatus]
MLGLLPSAQFDIWIRVSKERLHDILRSSIITGTSMLNPYTLWNAEYRMLLTKNFESSNGSREATAGSGDSFVAPDPANKDRKGAKELQDAYSGDELISRESLGDLSPAALSYIKQLESELVSVEKELGAQNKEKMKLERSKENNNDLLKYLRSLHPEMVCELSQPSSVEIEEIIRRLVQCTLQKTFDSGDQRLSQYSSILKAGSDHSCFVNQSMVCTSRDHLAKLLYWCMLLGHHLRGLEYRLQLSCVVGLV